MSRPFQLMDTVALLEDLPDAGLERGQVGKIVELLVPEVHLVQFVDNQGKPCALLPVHISRLLVLKLDWTPVQD